MGNRGAFFVSERESMGVLSENIRIAGIDQVVIEWVETYKLGLSEKSVRKLFAACR